MKILLIAGHGGSPYDCGAVGCGYKEADLTRELVKLIKAELSSAASVDIADTEKNWFQYICNNGGSYNFKQYDYVLEVHFNACVKDTIGNGKTTGTEIYVTKSEKGTAVEEAILKNIAKLGLKDRGVKRKNFALIYYIKNKGVSSALLETCFIDDVDDMKVYKEKKVQIARAVADGIIAGFGLTKAEKKPEEFRVKVLADSLNIRAGAGTKYASVGAIKDHGVYTIVETRGTVGKSGSWGKLKSGKGWISLYSKYAKKL